MDEGKTLDREGLAARVNALRVAELALRNHTPGAALAVRRISRSLRVSESAHQNPEVSAMAALLEQTSDEELENNLQKVLPRLRGIAANLKAKHLAVMIVEDDPVAREILQQRLAAPNRQIHSAGTLAEAETMLVDNEISLVILDLQLPDGDGRELLLKLRERPATSSIPIIVLSATRGSQVQTECFALGADAFFEKPFDPVTISTVVAAKLQRAAEVTKHSSQDSLTGLPNRVAFTNAFTRAARLASRGREPLTVAILDVDRFKSVNDIYGHAMGDKVLRRLASVVSKSLRASDLLARWGGEEFAVFFPSTDLSKARLALNKALAAFRAEKFTTSDGRIFQVTFSAGVSEVKSGMTVEQAIAEADRFLYMAKASGRDHVLTETDNVAAFKKNVLLVEDDDLTASVIKHYLKREGFKVLHAKDGEAALGAVEENASISLVTLDVKIPGLDGFELLQRFRSIAKLQQVPIVMLTSAGKQEDIVKGFQLGADDYILKPFSPRELLARVHRLLQKT
jgi:two-component system, cell cycle response regulator